MEFDTKDQVLSLIPCSLTPSTVPLKKFRWELLPLWLLSLLSKVKVKSTSSLRPKTWSLTKTRFMCMGLIKTLKQPNCWFWWNMVIIKLKLLFTNGVYKTPNFGVWLISLLTNRLEGCCKFHLKGRIYRSVWSTKTFLFNIREPRYQ